MTLRRPLLLSGLAAAIGVPLLAQAQQRRSLADPLRAGVDPALMESGLASALQKAFGRDTGIAVQLIAGPALPVLDALERGEHDVALTNAPDAEERLERQGLVHDRLSVANGTLALVGPVPTRKKPDPAGIARMTDVAQALVQLRSAALATPGALGFLSPGDGSGTHAAEQALWRTARIAPAAPWYASAAAGGFAAQVRARGAYALVDRGAWAAIGGAPQAVLVDADPRQALPVHVMGSFRVSHPAARIFTTWITGPKGRRVVAAQRGYRAPG
jgi:tungstate transport system substrate-binding protein